VSTNTPNFNLVKPSGAAPGAGGDLVDITVLDGDLDIIDTVMKTNADGVTNLDTRLDSVEAKLAILALETETISTVSSAGITNVETILMTLPSVTYDGLTEVELMYSYYNGVLSDVDGTFFLRFYDGATLLQNFLIAGQGAHTNQGGAVYRTRFTPIAGAHAAITVKVVRNSGAGSFAVASNAGFPHMLSARPIL
jgi:hypothetical protein